MEQKNYIPRKLGPEFKGIEILILKSVYLKSEDYIETREIKEKIIELSKEFSKKNVEFLYKQKDKYGSMFYHAIRRGITKLSKNGFIESKIKNEKKGPYKKTKKLKDFENIEEFYEKVNNFAISLQKYLNFNLKYTKDIKKFEKEIENEKSEREIENKKFILKLRSKFKKELQLELKEKMKKNFLENNNFKYPDAAHIIPVFYLIKNKRYQDISDPNNGLMLDPNTHRLFDCERTIIQDNIILCDWNILISKKFLNIKRQKFINERNELIKEGKI